MASPGLKTVPIQPPQLRVTGDTATAVPAALGQELQPPVGVILVPTEAVLLLAAEMPAIAAAQRRAAVGFAIEDRIAQPLDDVQVALGPQISPGTWLVAVSARTVLADAGSKAVDHLLWPDVFLLPVPRNGWAVWCGAGRALVRLPDGTGFATPLAALPAFWAAGGSPETLLYGGEMPMTIPVTGRAALPPGPDPTLDGFDLRAGLHRAGGISSWLKGARPLAAVLLVAALGHLGLLGMDVIALHRLAEERVLQLRDVLNAPVGADLDAAVAQALAARQPADSDGMLALLSQTFGAIAADAGRVSVQDLRYARVDRAAVLSLEAPDLVSLQAIETALAGAGLRVTAGAATSRDGAAEVQITIRSGGA